MILVKTFSGGISINAIVYATYADHISIVRSRKKSSKRLCPLL